MKDNRSHLSAVLTLIAIFSSACAAVDTTEETEPTEAEGVARQAATMHDEPPSGTNGMTPACFWAAGSQEALRALGGAALDAGDGTIPAISSGTVPLTCREVIQYAIQCALPAGQTLHDPVTGGDYAGWWGLAPSWRTQGLSTKGRREITACLVERLNGAGAHVPILLEGANPAIAQRESLQAAYPVAESTAFGDLFSSTTPLVIGLPAFNAFVCQEDPSEVAGILQERICAHLPVCGLTMLGPCETACVPNGPYWSCRPSVLSPVWTETVRVKLQDTATE